ncbi:MAG: hypothetical protein JXQ73_34000 [Phycisphaerae bacterium]|nr:hypothetical protein [Phycisphaerae bacterium]
MPNERGKPANGQAGDLTRYCPVCQYDLRGLTENRCPECGHAFDPTTLPLVRTPPDRVSPLATLALGVAVLLAWSQYSWGMTRINTAAQIVWIVLMWAFAAAWMVLRRRAWSRQGQQYRLLWLLVLCAGTISRPYLPNAHQLALSVFALAVGAAVLTYTLVTCLVGSIRALLTVFSCVATVAGVLWLVGTLGCYVHECATGVPHDGSVAAYHFFGTKLPASGVNHLYAAGAGAAMAALGFGAFLARRLLPDSN